MNVPVMTEADMGTGIAYVRNGLDSLLAKHGYERNGNYYHAVHPNEKTIALFCHFGVECVMLGHLLGISPMALRHGFMAAPTSVATVCTEERREGIAYFRVTSFGGISHTFTLTVKNLHFQNVFVKPSVILSRGTIDTGLKCHHSRRCAKDHHYYITHIFKLLSFYYIIFYAKNKCIPYGL